MRRAYRAEVRRHQRAADARFGPGCGEVSLEQVLEALFRKKGAHWVTGEMVRGAGMLLRVCSTDQAELYPGAHQLLDTLRSAGKKGVPSVQCSAAVHLAGDDHAGAVRSI